MNLLLEQPLLVLIIIPLLIGVFLWIAFDALNYWDISQTRYQRLFDFLCRALDDNDAAKVIPVMIVIGIIYALVFADFASMTLIGNVICGGVAALMVMEGWFLADGGDRLFWYLYIRRFRISRYFRQHLLTGLND